MSTQSDSDFLYMTPPFCGTVECYVHGVPEQEHHVEGCPMAETLHGAMHRLSHAMTDATAQLFTFSDEIRAAMLSTWRGRLTYYWMQLRGRWPL